MEKTAVKRQDVLKAAKEVKQEAQKVEVKAEQVAKKAEQVKKAVKAVTKVKRTAPAKKAATKKAVTKVKRAAVKKGKVTTKPHGPTPPAFTVAPKGKINSKTGERTAWTSKSGMFSSLRNLTEVGFAKKKDMTYKEMAAMVKKEYPTRRFTERDYAWHKTHIVSHGRFTRIPAPSWAKGKK